MQNNIVSLYSKADSGLRGSARKVDRTLRRLNGSAVCSAAAWVFIVAFSVIGLFLCCRAYPLESDDLRYLCRIQQFPLSDNILPLEDIGDIIESQYNHWLMINGRTVAHLPLQLALFFLNENILDLMCTLFTAALAFVISRYRSFGYADCRIRKTDYMLAFSFLALFNPDRMDTLVWTTGVFNYNFTILIVLLFFCQYMRLLDDSELKRSLPSELALCAASFIGGVLAGWTNENISPAMIAAIVFIIAYRKLVFGRRSPASAFTGLFGAVCGCLMLLLAPGNFARSSIIAEKESASGGLMDIAIRGYYMERALFDYLLPVVILTTALIIANRFAVKEKLNVQSTGLLILAALSYIAMAFSPAYPPRAAFGTFVIALIPALSLLSQLRRKSAVGNRVVWFAFLLFIAANAQLYTEALYSMLKID